MASKIYLKCDVHNIIVLSELQHCRTVDSDHNKQSSGVFGG